MSSCQAWVDGSWHSISPSSSRIYERCSYLDIWTTSASWPDKKRARAVSCKSPSLPRCSPEPSVICSMSARHQPGPVPPLHRHLKKLRADLRGSLRSRHPISSYDLTLRTGPLYTDPEI